MQQLKALGELLLDIHGQHFHQSLGRKPVQRDLLDHFGGLLNQREATEAAFEQWRVIQDQLQALLDADANRESRLDLLQFQLAELDALALQPDDVDELQLERKKEAAAQRQTRRWYQRSTGRTGRQQHWH